MSFVTPKSQGQGPVCEWLVCEYTTSREVSLSPLLPCSLPSSLNPSSARFLSPLFLSRHPCPVPSLPRSFPSSPLPPSTLSSSTDALSLHSIIASSLPPSSCFLLPTLHPSSLLPCPLPVSLSTAAQFNEGLHRVCMCLASWTE